MHWISDLETGIEMVDQQHKAMFDRLDTLLDKNHRNRVPETLEFLGEYVVRHFGCEELMMRCSKFPDIEHHAGIHEEFVAKYKELKQEYEKNGEDMLALMKLTSFIRDWLYDHIMIQDKKFAEYFKNSRFMDGKNAFPPDIPHSA